MKYKDYYAALGVDKKAGADDIKKAYRKLARKYHPDVSKEKNAKEKFQEVSKAYETLKAKGVEFVQPATDRPYGTIEAIFKDNSGNVMVLAQDKHPR